VTRWHGTDFNPSQASFAQELARASGSDAKLYDEAFAEFVARTDLPEFDYIGLHGIWSWISDDNRRIIVDFIRRKLKVGGVLYISYNTLPGWAAFAPMRHLMAEHAQEFGVQGKGIINRVCDAIDFAEKMLATQPQFAQANAGVPGRLQTLKGQNRQYLAHEYFNRDWLPMHFANVRQWLEQAKVQFACSAHYLDHIESINLTAEQQQFLKDIPSDEFRQTVRDFMVNQQFRRDYWVKGRRQLSPLEQNLLLSEQRLLLTTHRPDVPLKVQGAQGEATMAENIYTPLLDYLADHQVRTLAQIERALQGQNITLPQLIQAVMVLIGAGHVCAAQDEQHIIKARKHSDKLNQCLILKARSSGEVATLSSPVTGGGMVVTRFNQLFVLALQQGYKKPEEWAEQTWKILQAQGQKIQMNGHMLPTPEDNIAELLQQAQTFASKQLPILKALQIV